MCETDDRERIWHPLDREVFIDIKMQTTTTEVENKGYDMRRNEREH